MLERKERKPQQNQCVSTTQHNTTLHNTTQHNQPPNQPAD